MADVLIIGGGPAGVSAALYTARAGISTKIIYKDMGALTKAEKVDNFYGTPGITGPDLIKMGLAQAEYVGAEIEIGEVVKIQQQFGEKTYFEVETVNASYTARTLLLATGSSRAMPKIPGLEAYDGKGISHCALCDAFFYKGKDVAVLGHSQYALSEAKELLPLAKSVTILTNGNDPEIDFPPELTLRKEKINEVLGETRLTGVNLESEILPIDGLFIALGTAGATALARKLGAFTENNTVIIDENTRTNIPGLWAAGDCTPGMKQIAKAVYQGAIAGTDIVRFLREVN
ncbi:MAG: NAD(P)/FAD-dependent oxidoreductase [Defluviitaleaceae bacterium]|nr:NAD(P)/FAD-dependent oxidoreductase [Defluviitaleaceae bacterium]